MFKNIVSYLQLNNIKNIYNNNKRRIKLTVVIFSIIIFSFILSQVLYCTYVIYRADMKSIEIKNITINDNGSSFINVEVVMNKFKSPLNAEIFDIYTEIIQNKKTLIKLKIDNFNIKKGENMKINSSISIEEVNGDIAGILKSKSLYLKISLKAKHKFIPFSIPVKHTIKQDLNFCAKDPNIIKTYVEGNNYITELKVDLPLFAHIYLSKLYFTLEILDVEFKIETDSLDSDISRVSKIKILGEKCKGVPNINNFLNNNNVEIKIKECNSFSLNKKQIEKIFKNQNVIFTKLQNSDIKTDTKIQIIKNEIIMETKITDEYFKKILKIIELPMIELYISDKNKIYNVIGKTFLRRGDNIITKISINELQKVMEEIISKKILHVKFSSIFHFMSEMVVKISEDEIKPNFMDLPIKYAEFMKLKLDHNIKESNDLIIIDTNKIHDTKNNYSYNENTNENIKFLQINDKYILKINNSDISISFNNFKIRSDIKTFIIEITDRIEIKELKIRTIVRKINEQPFIFINRNNILSGYDDKIKYPVLFIEKNGNEIEIPIRLIKPKLNLINNLLITYIKPIGIETFILNLNSRVAREYSIENNFRIPKMGLTLITKDSIFLDFVEFSLEGCSFKLNYKNDLSLGINKNVKAKIKNLPLVLDLLAFKGNGRIFSDFVASVLNLIPLDFKRDINSTEHLSTIISKDNHKYKIILRLPTNSYSFDGIISTKIIYPDILLNLYFLGLETNIKIKGSYLYLTNINDPNSLGRQPDPFIEFEIEIINELNIEKIFLDDSKEIKIKHREFEKIIKLGDKHCELTINRLNKTDAKEKMRFAVTVDMFNNMNKYLFLFFKFLQLTYLTDRWNIEFIDINYNIELGKYNIAINPHNVMLINNVDHLSIVCTGFTTIDFDEKKSNKINISRYMKYIELKENGVDIKIPFFRRVLFKDYVVCLVCKSFYQNFVINDGDKISFILGDKKGFKSKENRLELYHKRSNNNYMENIVSIKIKSQSDTSIKLGLFLLTQKITVKILNSVIDFILGNV